MEELSKDKELVCDVKEMVRLVKETQDIPCVVGLGNSSFEKAAEAAAFSDGVIVSGDMMNIVERYGKDCVPYAAEYVATMKKKIQSV
jgi:tryptophan synthase alpha chain